MVRAKLMNERFHFQYSDPESAEEVANLMVERDLFLSRLDRAEADVRKVVASLKEKLGFDPWS